MNVELKSVSNGIDDELTPDQTVAMAARGDYMSDSLVGTSFEEVMEGTEKNLEELIKDLLRKGHFGPAEHVQFYFAAENVSRVTMAQVTRHRHFSWDVQSQRYVNFEDKEAIIPPSFEDTETGTEFGIDSLLKEHWKDSVRCYEEALNRGIPKEDARFFLPQATPVNMSFSANMRAIMHLVDLRHSGAAQWEAQDFAEQVLNIVREEAPLTIQAYEDHVKNNSLRAP